jgi:hypothetical protein
MIPKKQATANEDNNDGQIIAETKPSKSPKLAVF